MADVQKRRQLRRKERGNVPTRYEGSVEPADIGRRRYREMVQAEETDWDEIDKREREML